MKLSYISYYFKKLLDQGLYWTLSRIFSKLINNLIAITLQPIALIGHVLGYRRIAVSDYHIGHLAAEPDCFLKLKKLGLLKEKYKFFIAPTRCVANQCLLDYWRPHITIINNPMVSYLCRMASKFSLMHYDIADYIMTNKTAALYFDVCRRWEGQAPLLTLTDEHRSKGKTALKQLGLPDNAWFVCLHVREAGFSPATEFIHSYRNADIENFRLAVETIASQGGWVIRVGDASMKKIENLPNFIDYTSSSQKSDWMDVYLCAECKLFIGDTSGLFLVSTIFGVRSVLANMTPLAAKAYCANDLYIPKLLRDKVTGSYLKFSDVLNSPAANFRETRLYDDAGIVLEENSPEDINDLVTEALLKLNNKWVADADDELQQEHFNALFQPHHYGYYSASRIGAEFLKKHADLV